MWLPLTLPLLGTWPATQAMCPDWELNQKSFGSQASTQSTESHQPGLELFFFLIVVQLQVLELLNTIHMTQYEDH